MHQCFFSSSLHEFWPVLRTFHFSLPKIRLHLVIQQRFIASVIALTDVGSFSTLKHLDTTYLP